MEHTQRNRLCESCGETLADCARLRRQNKRDRLWRAIGKARTYGRTMVVTSFNGRPSYAALRYSTARRGPRTSWVVCVKGQRWRIVARASTLLRALRKAGVL